YGLLILGETSSKLVSPDDESTAMMFGDAGAAILYVKEDNRKIKTLLMTDGNRFKSIIVPSGGFRDMHPKEEYYITQDGKSRSKYCSYMDGVSVFSFAITDVVNSIKEFLVMNKTTVDAYNYIVLHQANNLIVKRIAHKLGISNDKVLSSLEEYGNTSGVSIPLTLSHCLSHREEGLIKILIVGYGIGLSWGVSSLTIDTDRILNVIETDSFYSEGIIK
ncbi:3-oxoacyl-ACP synthase III family protein, partial [Intestinibacter sp.]|uniref:3-oxoacyl-ACP synthase III family protein n=1 Tax=Intestinibacter sp. TaxID=1965304 RepID=UPI003F17DB2D